MNEDKMGFVTRFQVERSFLDNYETHVVGGSQHEEYWNPAEELILLNKNIVGKIEIIAEYKSSE